MMPYCPAIISGEIKEEPKNRLLFVILCDFRYGQSQGWRAMGA